MRIIQLLEFGMRNVENKNRLLRILGKISICIAENYAERIEKKTDRKQKKSAIWNRKHSERVEREIWKKISEKEKTDFSDCRGKKE
ncbi:MAG: hypothetical protein Q4B90_00955 [Eubacteriales bacterium]|nr:hypothetical protein [Eubacteriales bacterium]